MLTAIDIFRLLATGAGAGFASALLGIGGGSIMVPITYWIILAMKSVGPGIPLKIAIGTSLLVILPTAISGAWRHNKKKAVRWKIALVLGSCALVGALVGATLAVHLTEETLKIGFGGLVLAVAIWMGLGLTPKLRKEAKEPREDFALVAACGFPIGMIIGLTGL
ncbi:MAG TPA: sulfite exporter TauE/SafE family protein, partial [Dehalococcoidia bacterium]|nr:sulfite exporter TauE/SafE family protein [Dehalococcoidia bacterium]